MSSVFRRSILKRRAQEELDLQRVVEEDCSGGKRAKRWPGFLNNATSNNLDSVSGAPSKCATLSPLPQSSPQRPFSSAGLKSIPNNQSIGPYRLLAPLDENSKVFTAVDTRNDGRLMICHRLDQCKYDRLVQLNHRLTSGLDSVNVEQREENQWAYEQIFPPNSEVIASDGGKFYYFEPKDFGSLHAYVVERKRLNEEECLRYFRQILRLLMYCHRCGVVLRDLKLRKFVFADPERLTIRLDGLDELYICPDNEGDDYDEQNDKIADRHGCPAYVGPEILDLGQKSYSGRAADIWSLGVLLYVILYGRYPFYDTTPGKLFAKIRHAQIHMPEEAGISFDARSLIRCLLRRDPNERPSAVDILAHSWLQSRGQSNYQPRRITTINGFRVMAMDKNSENDHCVPRVDLNKNQESTTANGNGGKKIRGLVDNDLPMVPSM